MNRIKTNEANKVPVFKLTKKFDFKDDRTIAQIAIALSLQLGKKFSKDDFGSQDNKGKEYPDTLLGELNRKSNDSIYRVILNQHYEKKLSEDEFSKYLKLHLDNGLEILNADILITNKGKNAHIDYLLSIINKGISLLNGTSTFNPKFIEKQLGAYSGLLDIQLGVDKDGEPVKIKLNNVEEFDSQHMAFAGMTRSGKTQLVKDILRQISEQSDYELKFIFFDYKGEGQSKKLKEFLDATKAEFIDIQQSAFKFNPLSYINIVNPRQRDLNIKSFRDSIASIDGKIGVKQKNHLMQAILNCFDRTLKNGEYPNLQDVYTELLNIYEASNIKLDTLTSILQELSGGIFDTETTKGEKLYEKSIYLNLPATLPDSVRQAAVFLTLNYLLSEYLNYNDVQISEDKIKPIRYVIVIDEAHVYLKSKNMVAALEDLLRMIGSKGVSVIMISQGVEEYKQKTFDFTSQVKVPVLLNVQNKDLKLVKSFLGTPRSDVALKGALKNLEGGKAVVNFKEPKLIDVNQFWKSMKKV